MKHITRRLGAGVIAVTIASLAAVAAPAAAAPVEPQDGTATSITVRGM